MENQEIWKPIPGWESLYSVSSHGRVRSECRTIQERRPHKFKEKYYQIPERILKQTLQPTGHVRVSLSRTSKIIYRMVHTLVLLAFVGDKPCDKECCHKDGNPKNNMLDNLYYGTRSQNIADAKRHGTFPMGEKRPGAVLNSEQVRIIYELCSKGIPDIEIAEKFHVTKGCVVQIRLGKNWKEITGGMPICRSLYRFKKLTEEQMHTIKTSSLSITRLAKLFNTDRHSMASWKKKLK